MGSVLKGMNSRELLVLVMVYFPLSIGWTYLAVSGDKTAALYILSKLANFHTRHLLFS